MEEQKPPTLPPREMYAIVVLGSMNPRIHHPQWYRMIGAITEEELQQALTTAVTVSPVISQFQVGAVPCTVICAPDRWEVQTPSVLAHDRLAEVASRVFEKLSETPVSQFALSANAHRETAAGDVKSVLSRKLVGLAMGLPGGPSTGSAIQITATHDDFLVTVQVQPSALAAESVFVSYNELFQAPGAPGYFNLGQLIRSRLDPHLGRARDTFAAVVAGLNASL